MSKYYTLEEIKNVRDEISRLGERRFDELKAEQNRMEAKYNKTRAECDKAMAEWNKTGVGWYETKAEYSKAVAEWDKMGAELDEIKAKLNRAVAEWDIKLFDILTSVCPEAHYREKGIKHKAFSIWTMPRGSCDEEDAKEVRDE
ncbi:MAG: hypothetical protein DDT23_00840 [candidate division WS2 bacterium]|nr:hypothetical protein [Candidatus Lithacetigena glycinireducens]